MATGETRWSLSLELLSKPGKVPTIIGVSAVYAAAHAMLFHPLLGDAAGILGVAPVLLFAMRFGAIGGALAGAGAMVFLMLTAVQLSDHAWLDWFWPAGMLGTSALIAIGVLTGRFRDAIADMKAELMATPGTRVRTPRVRTNGGRTASGRATANVPSARDLEMRIEQLSEREAHVLRLVAEGLPNKEIAETLNLSLHTVKTHVSVILRKLAVSNRTSAVGIARELDIID